MRNFDLSPFIALPSDLIACSTCLSPIKIRATVVIPLQC